MTRRIYEDPIEKELDDILAKYSVYEDLAPNHAKYLYDKFIERVKSAYLVHVSKNYPKGSLFCFHKKDIHTLVEQVWKRKVYFRVFHEDVDGTNELKEAALYCFWTLKLQPFYIYGIDDSMNRLNAQLALYILIAGILTYTKHMSANNIEDARLAKRANARKLSINMNKSIFHDLFYSALPALWWEEPSTHP